MSVDDDLARLVTRAQAGDRAAFAAVVRATQSDVWRLCSFLVDPGSAEDLSQETYLRAVRGLAGYSAAAPLRHWLLSIARRVCADEIRSRTRRRKLLLRLDPPAQQPDPAGETDLRLMVAQLEVGQREAFVLTQVLGLSYEGAAATVGCPVGTIRSRVFRARQELASALRAPASEADSA